MNGSKSKSSSKTQNRNADKPLLSGAIAAAVGAGIAASFSVAMGQSPWTAMGVTVISAGLALACGRLGLV